MASSRLKRKPPKTSHMPPSLAYQPGRESQVRPRFPFWTKIGSIPDLNSDPIVGINRVLTPTSILTMTRTQIQANGNATRYISHPSGCWCVPLARSSACTASRVVPDDSTLPPSAHPNFHRGPFRSLYGLSLALVSACLSHCGIACSLARRQLSLTNLRIMSLFQM